MRHGSTLPLPPFVRAVAKLLRTLVLTLGKQFATYIDYDIDMKCPQPFTAYSNVPSTGGATARYQEKAPNTKAEERQKNHRDVSNDKTHINKQKSTSLNLLTTTVAIVRTIFFYRPSALPSLCLYGFPFHLVNNQASAQSASGIQAC